MERLKCNLNPWDYPDDTVNVVIETFRALFLLVLVIGMIYAKVLL